jgi:hypothetical protein
MVLLSLKIPQGYPYTFFIPLLILMPHDDQNQDLAWKINGVNFELYHVSKYLIQPDLNQSGHYHFPSLDLDFLNFDYALLP